MTPPIVCAPSAPSRRGASSDARILDADLRAACAPPRTPWRRSPPLPTQRVDAAPILALLERARVRLEGEVALGLTFQGSYSQSKAKDPVYGGHATAMGPAGPVPAAGAAATAPVASPVTFEEAASLPVTTYSGGPTKDHILESGGNGIALLDYDGDGRLDVYLVTGAELSPSRAAHPAPQRALPQSRAAGASRTCRRRPASTLAAWGSGVCAGDVDGDGRLDLYVTNWGANVLFRNKGDGTFEDVAAQAGVAAGGWSTGCAFFDADADGDLDLYVARYVETTWDEVVARASGR